MAGMMARPLLMANRGFCPHGKVWTTCAICGKEVIAAAAKRGGGDRDDFVEYQRPKKRPAPVEEEAPAEEPAEETET